MLVRPTARVILFDADRRILLIQFEDHSISDPSDPETIQPPIFWVTPGGGLEGGETFEDAARREVFEETGIDVSIGPSVFEREKVMLSHNQPIRFHERYFVAWCDRPTVSIERHTELEKTVYRSHRWWTLDDIVQTTDAVFPLELADLVRSALEGGG